MENEQREVRMTFNHLWELRRNSASALSTEQALENLHFPSWHALVCLKQNHMALEGGVESSLPRDGECDSSARSFQLQEITISLAVSGTYLAYLINCDVEMDTEDTQWCPLESPARVNSGRQQENPPPPPTSWQDLLQVLFCVINQWLTISFLNHNCKLVNAVILKCILFSNSKDVL